MSELETLNMLLRLIGSSPVNNINTTHPDAANALATMKRISRRAQRRGWWFNVDYNVTLTPDANNEIIVPANYNSVVLESRALVQRGSRIYNKQDQTGKFTAPVVASRVTIILDWDDLPAVVQEYCAYYAGSEYVRDELEDANKQASLGESASASYMDMKKQDLEEGQYNIFQKARVRSALNGIRPVNRGDVRFYGSPDA